ncbi:MAG: DUF2844 domain-containing protein [Candidatus Acidiferrum sp.]
MKATILCGILAILAVPFPAAASLGGDVASVQADVAKMQASLQTSSSDSYTIHEIQAPTGVAVKEYVSSSGKVFAVTWQGSVHPDLQQLLGTYYDQYVQAVQAQRAHRRGRGPLLIQEPGLVIQITGHMRSFRGKAYVPQMLPAGVRVEDIR